MSCQGCSKYLFVHSFTQEVGTKILQKRDSATSCGQKVLYRTAAALGLILLLPVSIIELVARAVLQLFAATFVLLSRLCTKRIKFPETSALSNTAAIPHSIILSLVVNTYKNVMVT